MLPHELPYLLVDPELAELLTQKPSEPEINAVIKSEFDFDMLNAIDRARFCEECPHEKRDHPKRNRFRCRWCKCEGTSIKRAIYQRQKGKRIPS